MLSTGTYFSLFSILIISIGMTIYLMVWFDDGNTEHKKVNLYFVGIVFFCLSVLVSGGVLGLLELGWDRLLK